MKVNSKVLFNAVQKAYSAVDNSPIIPIMDTIKLSTANNTAFVSGGNLEISVTSEVPCDGDIDCCVNAKMFHDTLKALPDQPIEIADRNNKMTIVTSNGKFSLPTEDTEDYPKVEQYEDQGKIFLPSELTKAIGHVAFCTSTDELRPALTGVYFDNGNVVATDAHRLAIMETSDFGSFIIPARAAKIVASLNDSIGGGICITDKDAIFRIGNDTISCRLIDAAYPDYQAIIPTDNNKKLIVEKNIALSSIKRARIFANDVTNSISLLLQEGEIKIKGESEDKRMEELVVAEYEGSPIEIGVNAKFLEESVKSITGDQVTIEFSSPSKAIIITGEEEFILLMPVQLNSDKG